MRDAGAYSYSDIDALVLVTYADQDFTPWIIERETVAASDWCTRRSFPDVREERS
jgi:hypothetical protein